MATIIGTSGKDLLLGTSAPDLIRGAAANDVLLAEGAGDRLYGDTGNDRLYADSGGERLFGGVGNDRLYGGSLQYGDDGNDLIRSSGDDDRTSGGNGNDAIYAGAGDDKVRGDAGDDRLWGGTGDDYLMGGNGNDVLTGETEGDRLYGGAGNDRFVDADPSFSGGPLVSFDDGGPVGLRLNLLTGIATRGAEADRLTDIYNIQATTGDDVVTGATNSNVLGEVDFTLHGLDGDDAIVGYNYVDEIYGGNGNDHLWGGNQPSGDNDFLFGGSGDDVLRQTSAARGGNGTDTIRVSGDLVLANGDGGADRITITLANRGEIHGGAGNDVISDMTSDDLGSFISPLTLAGDTGRDVCIGGGTYDVFAFADGDTVNGANRDVIRNFDQRETADDNAWDVIDVNGIVADPAGGVADFTFVGLTTNPGAGELGYYRSGPDTIVVGGAGASRFEIELEGFSGTLEADDFIL